MEWMPRVWRLGIVPCRAGGLGHMITLRNSVDIFPSRLTRGLVPLLMSHGMGLGCMNMHVENDGTNEQCVLLYL